LHIENEDKQGNKQI